MVEPKGSLDAFSRKAYPVILGRREAASALAGFWVTMYGRIWVTAEAASLRLTHRFGIREM